MKRALMALALSGVTFLAATTGASCSSQATDMLALLCPECYQHYLLLNGKN